jgi:hypothetical protein
MNPAVKAHFLIPSGFREFLDKGFDGWQFVFLFYTILSGIIAFESTSSWKIGIYIFLQPVFSMLILCILSTVAALILGAKEPLIKGLRLTGLCLPSLGLTFIFLSDKSPLVYIAAYSVILFIYGSAFVGSKSKILNAVIGIVVIGSAGLVSYIQATTIDKWFDQELTFDGYKAQLSTIPAFNKNEMKVYSFLLKSTPQLGHIPQVDEMSDSLSIKKDIIRNTLMSLDEKGAIVVGADFEIRYAYPWAAYDNGYRVTIQQAPGAAIWQPVYAASALHALAAISLFKNAHIWIRSQLYDTGEPLTIEIQNGQIIRSNHPEVQIYKSDIISEIEFYSSPSGAKSNYRGRFDATHLLNLERGIIVADEMIRNKAAGLL